MTDDAKSLTCSFQDSLKVSNCRVGTEEWCKDNNINIEKKLSFCALYRLYNSPMVREKLSIKRVLDLVYSERKERLSKEKLA